MFLQRLKSMRKSYSLILLPFLTSCSGWIQLHASRGASATLEVRGTPKEELVVETEGKEMATTTRSETRHEEVAIYEANSNTSESGITSETRFDLQDEEIAHENHSGENDSLSTEYEVQVLGGGPGIRAIGQGPARLIALIEEGINIDGYRVHLNDLTPFAVEDSNTPSSAAFLDTPELEAHAELEHHEFSENGEANIVIRLRGKANAHARSPLRVHLVLDRSSSMQSDWPHVLHAARTLINQLEPHDEIQIVAYSRNAVEVLAPTPVGQGQQAHEALNAISVGGGTNIEAGLRVAYQTLASENRRSLVVLLSDGVPNHGYFDAEEFSSLTSEATLHHGCKTTVVGVGNQFDPIVLQAIASAGQGGYHVARNIEYLEPLFREEIRSSLQIAARDAQLSLRVPSHVNVIHSSEHGEVEADNLRITIPQLSAGQERRVVVRVRANRTSASSNPRFDLKLEYRTQAGHSQRGETQLSFEGDETRLASQIVLDQHLGQAIDEAAVHVRNGAGLQAASVFHAHIAYARHHPLYEHSSKLEQRTQAASRFARALENLVGEASHTERRELSNLMGSFAMRLRWGSSTE